MKSKYHNRPVPERLGIAKGFFETSKKDPEALEILSKRSFNAEKIALGYSFYDEASKEFISQQESISGKKETNSEFKSLFEKLSKDFSELFRYSKIAFADNKEVYYTLGLNNSKKNSVSGVFKELLTYFGNIFNSGTILQKLKNYGYSKDDLIAFNENYKNVYQLYLTSKKEETESIEKTEKKDEKMEILDEFMYELIAVSKIIEESIPNFMKRIGLVL